jgi:guanosine-3',5'-bis(diphosphate) 3'-pyrophosphohydrolase
MLWTEKTGRALLKAAQLHDGQYRKNGEGIDPYILHPLQVADIVSNYTSDEDVVSAALLHDTLEDTGYTKEEMASEFGNAVADLVESVSIPEATGAKREWIADRTAYIIFLVQLQKVP